MATALLITRDDIVRFTQMNGNLDTDTFIQYIKISQDIEIQEMLGTDLLKKIQADIVASNLVDPYLSLLNDYIKDCLIHFAYARYLPNGAYTISNKGIYKHNSENSDTVSKEEIDYLFDLLEYFLKNKIDDLNKKNIKLNIIGVKNFSKRLNKLLKIAEKTQPIDRKVEETGQKTEDAGRKRKKRAEKLRRNLSKSSLNNVYVIGSSILFLNDRYVRDQIQNRLPKRVDPQSVDPQSVRCQIQNPLPERVDPQRVDPQSVDPQLFRVPLPSGCNSICLDSHMC